MSEITEIIAEIKSKVRDIDAQLSDVEVGELSETANGMWQIARNLTQHMSVQLNDHLSDEEAIQWIVSDFRHALGSVKNALDVLLHFEEVSAEFSSVALMRMQSVFDEIESIIGKTNTLVDWYRSQHK